MRSYFSKPPAVSFAKNEKWTDSALLGLANGVYWSPTLFIALVREPLRDIAKGLYTLALALGVFVGTRFLVIGAGLCGRLRDTGRCALRDYLERSIKFD